MQTFLRYIFAVTWRYSWRYAYAYPRTDVCAYTRMDTIMDIASHGTAGTTTATLGLAQGTWDFTLPFWREGSLRATGLSHRPEATLGGEGIDIAKDSR